MISRVLIDNTGHGIIITAARTDFIYSPHRDLELLELVALTIHLTISPTTGINPTNLTHQPTHLDKPEQKMTPTPITVPSAIPPLPVFSQGMISNGHIYISGNIGCEQTSEGLKVVLGGVRAQTKAALTNIRTLLEASNSSLAHVVKANVYLTDMANFGDMNEVYATFFEQGKMPARTCIGVAALPLGADVEIECVAEVIKV